MPLIPMPPIPTKWTGPMSRDILMREPAPAPLRQGPAHLWHATSSCGNPLLRRYGRDRRTFGTRHPHAGTRSCAVTAGTGAPLARDILMREPAPAPLRQGPAHLWHATSSCGNPLLRRYGRDRRTFGTRHPHAGTRSCAVTAGTGAPLARDILMREPAPAPLRQGP